MNKIIKRMNRLSQRTDGFRAGIPTGLTTFDIRTKKLDSLTKLAARQLANDPDICAAGLVYTKEFTQEELGGKGGKQFASPDGGVWRQYRTGEIVGIIEAKKQGATGNAFERWYANQAYLQDNGGKRSLTILSGEGILPGASMNREVVGKLLREGKSATSFNVNHEKGCSFFASEQGYSYREILTIMKNWLLMRG